MSAAIIHHVEVAAGHDGIAELNVSLDEYATRILMQSTGVDDPEDLTGKGWEHVRDALAASSARYLNDQTSDQREKSHV